MTTPRLKETDYLLAGFAIAVGGFVASVVVGALAGGVLGFILGATGTPLETITSIAKVLGGVIGVVVFYLAFRWGVAYFLVRKLLAAMPSGGPSLSKDGGQPPPLPPL